MDRQTEEAVRDLRARMAIGIEILRKLESDFEHPYFKERAQRAISDVREAELMFLQPLEKETWRNVQQELAAVGYAEMIFGMALSERRQLEEVIAKCGKAAIVVPYP
jgi:hypothetical protein